MGNEQRYSRRRVMGDAGAVTIGFVGLLTGGASVILADKLLNGPNIDRSTASLINAKPTPLPTETPIPRVAIESEDSTESPVGTRGWNALLRDSDIEKLCDAPDFDLTIQYGKTDPDTGIITEELTQKNSTLSIRSGKFPEIPITHKSMVKRVQIAEPDGTSSPGYSFRAIDAGDFNTYMEIITPTNTSPIRLTINSEDEYDSARTDDIHVVTERSFLGVSLAEIHTQGRFLNRFIANGYIGSIAVLDIASDEIEHQVPVIESDNRRSSILFIPMPIAQMQNVGTSIEHPAFIRMSFEAVNHIFKEGNLYDYDYWESVEDTLREIESFCEKNEMLKYGNGWYSPEGEALNIQSTEYSLVDLVFEGVPVVPSNSYEISLNFLRNVLPCLRHRYKTYEKAYKDLTPEQKTIADEGVFLATKALKAAGGVNGEENIKEYFPKYESWKKERTDTVNALSKKYPSSSPWPIHEQ